MARDVETLHVPPNGGIPNNPALPALICRKTGPDDADAADAMFRANGWGGTWVWTVFDYHHFHPASHEALACVTGWADLQLGGPEGPIVRIEAGDVALLPAGFGHRRVASGDGFAVVGAYPPGQESPEIIRADGMDMDAALERIAATPLPDRDPLGAKGIVLAAWGVSP